MRNDLHIGECKLARFKQIAMETNGCNQRNECIKLTIPIMKCDAIMDCKIDVSL